MTSSSRNITTGYNYYPNILIITIGNHEQTNVYNMNQKVLANLAFLRIGPNPLKLEERNFVHEDFLDWNRPNKSDMIQKPERFFKKNSEEINELLSSIDIAIVVARTRDLDAINYTTAISNLLDKANVLTFHAFIENTIVNTRNKKRYDKMREILAEKNQMIIRLRESAMIESLKDVTLANRYYYTGQTLCRILEGFVAPFVDAYKNKYLYGTIKKLLVERKLKTNNVLASVGYSNDANGKTEKALFQALANPTLKGAFEIADTLKVDLRGTFVSSRDVQKIRNVLIKTLGQKNYLITYDEVEYELEKFFQVTIFALGVDYSKIMEDHDKVIDLVKTKIEKLDHDDFESEETRTIVLDVPFNKL